MNVEELKSVHLGEASRIFEGAFRRERADAPILDENLGTAARVLPRLANCLQSNPGVAVTDDGKLIAFMTGFQLDGFLSPHRGVYIPEWGHGCIGGNAFEIYRLMYRELGRLWVEGGCITHAINFMNHAKEAQEAFVWSGFGGICFDAVKPVERMDIKTDRDIRITLAEKGDANILLPMDDASARHLAGSPSFLPFLEPGSAKHLEEELGEDGTNFWIAWHGSVPVGYIKVSPVSNGAAWMVNGESKFAINGLYVIPEYRGRGIARMMLSAVMDRGAEEGFVRCSVDFEATNPEACRFWLKHFTPVCRSFVRRLDGRILQSIK